MVVAISDSRIVPITEDLTTEVSTLEILRGLETMYRVDKPLAVPGTTALLMGEFAVLNSAGKAERAGATPVGQTYLVFAGTDRFDVKATGQVTLVMSWPIQAKTTRYNTGGSYAVGDLLTVKNLGGGQSQLTPAATTEFAVARVLEVGTGYLVYETLGGGSTEL
jgi:hypothetical protein